MTSWEPAEAAFRAWVLAATTLGSDAVIYANQNGLSPAAGKAQSITVRLGDARAYGIDSVDQVGEDDMAETITQQVTGSREVMVELRAYSNKLRGDGTARDLLSKVQIYAAFPDIRDALNNAGFGLIDLGTVQSLPKIVNAGWETQAILEMRFCVLMTAQLTVPYIAHVNGTAHVQKPGSAPPVDVPFHSDLT